MNRKVFISVGILIAALLGELFLWDKIVLFSIILVILALIKYLIYPIKKELVWYLLICFGGVLIEIILVNFGHGWTYVSPNIFGIPIWIPLFWGLVGTTIVVIYEGFRK